MPTAGSRTPARNREPCPRLPERRGWQAHPGHTPRPESWFDNGGPIRTIRTGIEKRHLPGGAPGGGYDLAVLPRKWARRTAITEPLPLPLDTGTTEAA